MLLSKLRELFRCSLIAKNGYSRIARDEFYEKSNKRDYGKNDEKQDGNALDDAEQFILQS